jgi:hypothetical protein
LLRVTPRERAWADVHDLLPDGWRVGPPSYDPGRHRWNVTAISPRYSGRLRPPATIEAHGEDELYALTELVFRLRELRDIEHRRAIEEQARTAYIQGAEDRSRSTLGPPLSPDELERILRRYRSLDDVVDAP